MQEFRPCNPQTATCDGCSASTRGGFGCSGVDKPLFFSLLFVFVCACVCSRTCGAPAIGHRCLRYVSAVREQLRELGHNDLDAAFRDWISDTSHEEKGMPDMIQLLQGTETGGRFPYLHTRHEEMKSSCFSGQVLVRSQFLVRTSWPCGHFARPRGWHYELLRRLLRRLSYLLLLPAPPNVPLFRVLWSITVAGIWDILKDSCGGAGTAWRLAFSMLSVVNLSSEGFFSQRHELRPDSLAPIHQFLAVFWLPSRTSTS